MELKDFVLFLLTLAYLFGISESTVSEKSLFHDLPLNGAYTTDLENKEAGHVSASVPKLSPRSERKETQDGGKDRGETNSLFDSLPHQGAMLITTDTDSEAWEFCNRSGPTSFSEWGT